MNFAEWKNSVVPSIVRARKYDVLKNAVPSKLTSTQKHTSFQLPAASIPSQSPLEGEATGDLGQQPVTPIGRGFSTRTEPNLSTRTDVSRFSSTYAAYDDEEDREDVWGFLLSTLHGKVLSSLSPRVRDAEICDARGLWVELHKKFDKTDPQAIATLMRQLWRTDMSESTDITTHLNSFVQIQDKLIQVGKGFGDEVLAYAMLESLPDKYENAVSNLYQSEDLTSERVITSITRESERLQRRAEKDGTSAVTSSALVATKPNKPPNKPKPKDDKPKCPKHPDGKHSADDCIQLLKEKLAKFTATGDTQNAATAAVADVIELGEEDYRGVNGLVAEVGALIAENVTDKTYIIDSGATYHIVCNDDHLTNVRDIPPMPIVVGGKRTLYAKQAGTLTVGPLRLNNSLLAPEIGYNLLSVPKLDMLGYRVIFGGGMCEIMDKRAESVLKVPFDGHYRIKPDIVASALVARTQSSDALLYLHRSLGHLNWHDLWKLARDGRLGSEWRDIAPLKSINTLCEACVLGKGHRLPSPHSSVRATTPNEIVHVDLWGPSPTVALSGAVYFLTCYDDYTHRIQLYFLQKRARRWLRSNCILPWSRIRQALPSNSSAPRMGESLPPRLLFKCSRRKASFRNPFLQMLTRRTVVSNESI